jgi:Domain of unknown function (DUF4402)
VGHRKLVASAAMALAGIASPAVAAPVPATTDASGKAILLIPLTLTKLQDLDFGTVVTSSSPGTITIPADGSAPIVVGGVTQLASPVPARAEFGGAGSANQQVRLFLSPPASIKDGNGHSIPISMNLEATSVTIDSTRAFIFGVGGTINVAANQAEGLYTGTFTVLAQYN